MRAEELDGCFGLGADRFEGLDFRVLLVDDSQTDPEILGKFGQDGELARSWRAEFQQQCPNIDSLQVRQQRSIVAVQSH